MCRVKALVFRIKLCNSAGFTHQVSSECHLHGHAAAIDAFDALNASQALMARQLNRLNALVCIHIKAPTGGGL